RSQSTQPTRLCTRRAGGERTSIRVWCRHVWSAPSYGNQVRTHNRLLTAPGPGKRKKSKKPLSGGSLSLDNRGPHTGAAGGTSSAAGGCSLSRDSGSCLVSSAGFSTPRRPPAHVYLITSSARKSNNGESVRPRASAVCRLTV